MGKFKTSKNNRQPNKEVLDLKNKQRYFSYFMIVSIVLVVVFTVIAHQVDSSGKYVYDKFLQNTEWGNSYAIPALTYSKTIGLVNCSFIMINFFLVVNSYAAYVCICTSKSSDSEVVLYRKALLKEVLKIDVGIIFCLTLSVIALTYSTENKDSLFVAIMKYIFSIF